MNEQELFSEIKRLNVDEKITEEVTEDEEETIADEKPVYAETTSNDDDIDSFFG